MITLFSSPPTTHKSCWFFPSWYLVIHSRISTPCLSELQWIIVPQLWSPISNPLYTWICCSKILDVFILFNGWSANLGIQDLSHSDPSAAFPALFPVTSLHNAWGLKKLLARLSPDHLCICFCDPSALTAPALLFKPILLLRPNSSLTTSLKLSHSLVPCLRSPHLRDIPAANVL